MAHPPPPDPPAHEDDEDRQQHRHQGASSNHGPHPPGYAQRRGIHGGLWFWGQAVTATRRGLIIDAESGGKMAQKTEAIMRSRTHFAWRHASFPRDRGRRRQRREAGLWQQKQRISHDAFGSDALLTSSIWPRSEVTCHCDFQ